jgi:predicted  nucleic acid-binding Zn-ribbon protein
MFTVENKTRVVKQVTRVSSSTSVDMRKLEVLCERLLRAQPQSEPLLKRLLARSHRAFAPVHDGRCSGCNVTIATARI